MAAEDKTTSCVDKPADGHGMAAEDKPTTSVDKPADRHGPKVSPLNFLTAHSARFGHWEAAIFKPAATAREYLWNGEKRTSHRFQCMLVSTADPAQYVLGDSHGKGMSEEKANQLKQKFKEGLVFRMSKVVFATNVNQQYNNTPKTEVVSMQHTTWNPVLSTGSKNIMPEPGIPIAASMGIGREQLFDALALVQEVGEMAPGGTTSTNIARVRVQIKLNDGSKNDKTDNVIHLPVTIFADATRDQQEPQMFRDLRQAASTKTAMAFFGIQGKQSDGDSGKWAFTSSYGFFFERASYTVKGEQLESQAAVLKSLSAEDIPQEASRGRLGDENESFDDIPATETTCALFKSIMAQTKVKAIETETTFWQINWCQVHPPEKGATVCTNDNSRLWMPVKVEDETGNLTMYIREKAALALSGWDSKERFEAARADDDLYFPNKASIKIIRKPVAPQTPEQSDSSAISRQIQFYIVEAAEQAMSDTPSKQSLTLLKLLEQTEANADACVVAGISMIQKDPHYGLSVQFKVEGQVIQKRCTRAVALVCASKASEADNMNEGYQMLTKDVTDPLQDSTFACSLLSFCTVKNSPDYQLRPPRGQTKQTALVVIADVLDPGSAEKPPLFLVESLEKIPPTEADTAPDHIRRLIQFAALTAKMQGKVKRIEWTDETSPAMASKCRRLGKSPTDDAVEPYSIS